MDNDTVTPLARGVAPVVTAGERTALGRSPAVSDAGWQAFNGTDKRGGVPMSPEGYDLHSLPKFGAEERPLIDFAARECHAAGVPARIFQAAASAMLTASSWEAVEAAIIRAGGRNSDCDLAYKIAKEIVSGRSMNKPMPGPSADQKRLAEIRDIMKNDSRRYYRDESLRSEYLNLLTRNS